MSDDADASLRMTARSPEYFTLDPDVGLTRVLIIVLNVVAVLLFLLFKEWLGFWALYVVLALGVLALLVNELMMPAAMKRVVIVDFDRRVLTLRNYIYQQAFWDVWPKPEVEIPFDDIRGMELIDSRVFQRSLVHTATSRFTLHGDPGNNARLVQIIREIADGTPPVKPYRRQWVISFVAGFLGLGIVAALGWLLGWV